MSTREKCDLILDTLPEFQLELVLAYIQGLTASMAASDDAQCEALYQKYLDDPDKENFVSEEELCKELGLAI